MLIAERLSKIANKFVLKRATEELASVQGKMENGFTSVESAMETVLTAYDRAFEQGNLVKKLSYVVTAYSQDEGYKQSSSYKKPTVKCTVRFVGGKVKDIQFDRASLYPGENVWSKVLTDGYESRKAALSRFMGTDHPFRTGDENATWDAMLHNMRDFAVYG